MDIVDLYQTVTGENNLTRCQLSIRSDTIDDYQKLLDKISAFTAEKGWLCYQSEVIRFSGSSLPAREDKILCGELVKGDNSLHIRQKKAGWLISEITSSSTPDTVAGNSYLAKKVRYMVNEKEAAEYEVFFRKKSTADDENSPLQGGYLPENYRFLGFTNEKEESC